MCAIIESVQEFEYMILSTSWLPRMLKLRGEFELQARIIYFMKIGISS